MKKVTVKLKPRATAKTKVIVRLKKQNPKVPKNVWKTA